MRYKLAKILICSCLLTFNSLSFADTKAPLLGSGPPQQDYILALIVGGIGLVLLLVAGYFIYRFHHLSVELKRTNQQLAEMSVTDPLTGALNRRGFFEQAELMTSQAKRYLAPVALLIVDIDHFKRVNDTYGHHTGDTVLVDFVKLLSHDLRKHDVVGRLGGEEFAIVLAKCSLQDATVKAQGLLTQIREHPVTEHQGQRQFNVTASIGVALVGEGIQEAWKRADEALYRAKAGGRDQVVVCEQDESGNLNCGSAESSLAD